MTLEQALAEIFASAEFAAQFPGKPDADGDGSSDYIEALLGTNRSDVSVAPTAANSFVAQRMVDLGVVDPNMVAAEDDADEDGVSNADEILLGTSPVDGGATPTQKDVLVAQFLSQSFGFTTVGLNAADDDADADGQSNLMEIALGSDPTDAGDMAGTLPASIDGSDFVVTFLRLQDPSAGLIYTVQCSPMMELGSWNDADPLASTTRAPDQSGVPAGYERIEFRIDMNTQDCGFVRVVVN